METQIYKVRDPDGVVREIRGPVGATDEEILAQAQTLFAKNPDPKVETKPVEKPVEKPRDKSMIDYGAEALAGATALPRGILNLVSGDAKLGEKVWPTSQVDKGSAAYIAGEILDPLSWATGTKIAQSASLIPKLGNLSKGVIGATGAGATTGALTDSADRLESALTGGVGGAIGGVAVPAAIRGANWLGNVVGPSFSTKSAQKGGARLLGDTVEGRQQALIDALRNAGADETAIQAATRSGSAEATSLLDALKGFKGSEYDAVDVAQEAARKAALKGVTPDLEASIAARKATTDPMREIELNAANTAGQMLPEYTKRVGEKAQQAIQNLQTSGKAYALAGNEQRNLNDMLNVTPGWRSPQKLLEAEQRLVDTRDAVRSANAMKWQRQDEGDFLLRQAESLAAHGLKPLTPDTIEKGIRSVQGSKTYEGRQLVDKSIDAVKTRIADITDENGVVSAYKMYGLRKDLGDMITNLAKETNTSDKRLVAGIHRNIQNMIDDSIEAAGGTGWRDYLKKYGEMSIPVDQSKVLSKMQNVLDMGSGSERVGPFLNVLGSGEQALLKKSTGFPRYEEGDLRKLLSPQQMSVVDDIERQLRLDQDVSRMVKSGRTGALNALRAAETQSGLPNLMTWKVSLPNAILNRLQGKSGEKINRQLAEMGLPQNKVKLADLMEQQMRRKEIMDNVIRSGQGGLGAISGNVQSD